ncbi:ABC transporter ATP-binding protein [Amycolatopsis granulosa]|uniref:ABC transporter ATP-binding protein n=1 Tax=Amycolatopsis granulosa TaxID=185684 RepID=UPI00141F8B3E|nr:ABC transporter ATP-binding protein [Amycolatopsis granulosa]NIH84140.1 ABC-type multidrug transport system fused ATPase/permease subunit [Amycolatopsis granulosa]
MVTTGRRAGHVGEVPRASGDRRRRRMLPQALAVAAPVVRPHLPALAATSVLELFGAGVSLLRPWPLALAVDHAIGGRPASGLLVRLNGFSPASILLLAGAATVLLSVVAGVLNLASTVSAERAAEGVGARLRESVFEHTMELSLRWHDRMPSGELLSRLTSDVARMLAAVVAVATILIPDTFVLVVVLVVLALFDPGLALVGLAVLPLLVVLAVWQRRRVRRAQNDARDAWGNLSAVTNDLLRNVRAVQAFGRVDRARELFARPNRRLRDTEVKAATVSARWSPIADIVLSLGAGLVLVIGGRAVLSGSLSTGDLLVILAYLGDMYSPVRSLTRLSSVLAKAGASGKRVDEVLTASESVADAAWAQPAPERIGEVRFARVGFAYEPGHPVLRDFDLVLRAGETVCLLGPSGAGKSTVLHLLLRLYDADSGHIMINRTDIRDLQRHSLRQRIAFVPQDPWLLDATVADNIAFGATAADRAAVEEAGRQALVDEFVHTLPHGYDTTLGEGGVRLSGGQRRRVALARAAVSAAPLVLLDEPTASLDPVSSATVVQAIRGATAHRTVLIVTHDRDLAAIADRVVVLDRDPQQPHGNGRGGEPHAADQRPDVLPQARAQAR